MDRVERKLKDDLKIKQRINNDYAKQVIEAKLVLESYQAQKAITKLNGGKDGIKTWFSWLF